MEKLKMQTANIADENFKKLAALFPNAVTEAIDVNGNLVRSIDKDILMQEINTHVVEGREERYQFTWPEKRKSILAANAPSTNTLRPCRERSVDFDTTENLYIEGDNLEVLKLLQENYLGKIKMIYIDPPYNTGGDFVYPDDFAESIDEYMAHSGQYNAEGMQIVPNTESNGRFHTDWLNMMYPRLKVARNLLTENGVIFISIDDNEVENLRKICDEIFGKVNFLAQCVRKRRDSQANLSKNISPIHEYVVIYCRKNGDILNKVAANIDENDYRNPDNDPRGPYKTMPCTNKGGAVYTVTTPTGSQITEEWRFKKETYDMLLNDNRLVFPRGGEGKPRYKLFLSEKKAEGQLANTWLDSLASNQEATREIKSLFDNQLPFDTPKPVELLKFCEQLATDKDSIVLDFFSGSASTAHATMQLNLEDGGSRKFIMVQLPELTDEKSDAYKAGYKNICEIGEERIRRAAKRIKEEAGLQAQNIDLGFRVLKLDTSNMEDVYYTPEKHLQNPDFFGSLFGNIKEGRTGEDLLFQAMLELDIELSSKIETTSIDGKNVYNVADNYMLACFEDNVTDKTIEEIAKRQPSYFVMRDSSMADDSVAVNFEQLFKSYSPSTTLKVF